MTSQSPGQAAGRPAARRRFYKEATVAGHEGGHRVQLDGRPMRTPAGRPFQVPTAALAAAVAAEWEAQGAEIRPATMPLTRLVNTALDGVMDREADVRADIARYGARDVVCYRATHPADLVARQAEHWDPPLAWIARVHAVRLIATTGVMPVEQPAAALKRLARALQTHAGFALAALHVMTTLTGSAVLALACAERALPATEAWAAAHVDEDWQITQWGLDAEAAARRAARWIEMQAADALIAHLRGPGG